MIWTAIPGFFAAFGLTSLFVYIFNPLARRFGLFDHPGGRKDHADPTPVTGGLAIAAGTILPALLVGAPSSSLIGLAVAAAILLTVGVLDDLHDVRWYYRVLAQVAAALAIVVIGHVQVASVGPVFGFHRMELGELSIPFTVLATVGLINALNMCDGIDGLAGSMAFFALVMLAGAAAYAGNIELTDGLCVMAGAVAAFLSFNLRLPWQPRAKIFLGNSGSAYLGLVIAWAAFRLTQNWGHPVSPVLAPFLIAPPVIDCLVLMLRRILRRRSPFSADRHHMHHLMLDGGLSVTGVVAALSAISLCLGLAAAIALKVNVPQPYFLLSYLLIGGAYFAWSNNPAAAARSVNRLVRRGRPAAAQSPTPAEGSDL
jgi:UDP-GlcNAc:undecaprenyl-phosphate GlcNAc-1-phosphate transferase